ncbi:MAG: hypothetical protein M1839_006423 [Geoglossum umbratile]|nr:MAG: hypothetical protein M1839_006423 [Geoglossum umbratile]
MPPISTNLHDNVVNSKPFELPRDILSRLSSLSRQFRPRQLERGAEGAPAAARALARLDQLLRRQDGVIPGAYQDNNTGPSPGSVVGIVLGSLFGFLLILWLLWTCSALNGTVATGRVVRDRRPLHGRRVEEVVEVGRPPRRPERVYVQSRRNSLVDSSSSDVIEETVRIHRDNRPRSGIRYVNPDLPAGGNGHVEDVYVRKGSGSRRPRR